MAVVGTMRPEEAKVFDGGAGYHPFTNEDGTKHGSFEVFWWESYFDPGEVKPGWYWWTCHPGCSPEGDPVGPFGKSQYALEDADPNGVE